jgi:hypothetical protein
MQEHVLMHRLPGAINFKARELYRLLTEHIQQGSCDTCKYYPKYGTTIVQGDMCEHLSDITGYAVLSCDLLKIQKVKLIQLEEVSSDQQRIIFTTPVAQGQPA